MGTKTVDIADDVRGVLLRATIECRALILNDDMTGDRPLYLRVDKVLKALGGKWNGRERCHQFPEGALAQLKAALAGEGKIVDQKKTLEQFFTPAALARRMVDLAGIRGDIRGRMKVLEPSAGDGALVGPILESGGSVWAYEIDRKLREALLQKFYSQFGAGGLAGDFMAARPAPYFDRAVMNPPFSGGQDVRHVRHAFDFLRPGGVLVAIMSPHWTFADDRESVAFRAWLRVPGGVPKCGIGYANGGDLIESLQIEFLPEGTFKESGTNVSTVLVVIGKAE